MEVQSSHRGFAQVMLLPGLLAIATLVQNCSARPPNLAESFKVVVKNGEEDPQKS